MERVVVKLSSGLLVRKGVIQHAWLDRLAKMLAELHKAHCQVWLVTSGALALGSLKEGAADLNTAELIKQGQDRLFRLYKAAFDKSGLEVTEILLSKDQFEHRADYLAIKNQFEMLASRDVITLINERQFSVARKREFSDNDEIAGLVASLINAERVILASTVEGVLDHGGKCLAEVAFSDKQWQRYVTTEISATGKGGMLLKCQAAEHSAQRGVEAIICDGKQIENIKAAITGKHVGTRFIADRRISAKKRWIFDKKEFSTAVIQVDAGLAAAIESDRAVSVLTVGVAGITGNFRKDEIVAVKSDNTTLGYGQVRLSSNDAQKAIASQGSKILIHYDQYVRVMS